MLIFDLKDTLFLRKLKKNVKPPQAGRVVRGQKRLEIKSQ